jgi:hypothetical protein
VRVLGLANVDFRPVLEISLPLHAAFAARELGRTREERRQALQPSSHFPAQFLISS